MLTNNQQTQTEAPLSARTKAVQDFLKTAGVPCQVVEFSKSTRTAIDAAQAIGCQVSQIAKSIIFLTEKTSEPVLIIASGPNLINEKTISALVSDTVRKANANFVLEQTGFPIGGVAPFAHKTELRTFLDQDLLQHEEIWAAAGTPNAVFKITPQELVRLSKAEVISVA